ncbi:MAG: hypothetical protein COA79_09710 [Planctomycetota bacterium]|nr:MAG: hypothetical protein COA79_09710 [Planctomycetota bacterium]
MEQLLRLNEIVKGCTMISNTKKLEELLLKTIRCLKSLTESSNIKKDCIVNNDLAQLESVMIQENFLVQELKESEDSRVLILQELSTEENQMHQMKPKEFLKFFEKEPASRLEKLFRAIKTMANDINRLNTQNKELLNFAIENFNDFFQTLFVSQNPPSGYDQLGKIPSTNDANHMFLDSRA